MDFPRFVYRSAAVHSLAKDERQYSDLMAAGWFASVPEAISGVAVTIPLPVPAEDAPPTRAELEQKAGDLGLRFDGRTTDAKLGRMIEESLAGMGGDGPL